ncbi:MAG TPA: choice-of-anchor Q domain-containing protein [bacterium]|nr:choice-of-anchor Q domain-containing protein [bacterium]
MKKIFYFLIFLSLISGCSDEKKEDIYPDFEQKDDDADIFIPADKENPVPDSDSDNTGDEEEDTDIVDENDESEGEQIPDWEPDICTPNPCVMENSDGICTPFNDTFKCGCVENYYWVNGNCAQNPCLDNPCNTVENSTGECLIDGKGYFCVCSENYFWEKDSCKPIPGIIFVKADALGKNDGTSWVDAFTDLTDALESAGEPSSTQWIWVAKGIYKPKKKMNDYECGGSRCNNFAMRNNVSIICGFSGVESKIEERDFTKNETIFTGDLDEDGSLNENDSYHVFFNFNIDETSVIDGCIIEGGNANFESSGEEHMKFGGGINNINEVAAIIRNVVFRNNYGFIGGAMANMNNSAPLIENCTFENNRSVRGGAIANSMSSPKIVSSTFFGNFTTFENTGFGGAIFNNEGSSPEIEDSLFENNTSVDGGAMVNLDMSHPTITGTVFKNNTASRSGGAISNGNKSDPDIVNCLFRNNISSMGGGAIEIYQESYPRIVNSRFLFNKVTDEGFFYGGGILVNSSSIDIINSLFAGNSANSGGAVAAQWAILNLVNSTVTLNTAKGYNSYGGGVYNTGTDGESYIINSIIYDNYSEKLDNDISNDLTLTEVSYSNIKGCFVYGSWNSSCGEDKEWNIDLDPMFNDIKSGDFSLSADSPCIDKGSNDPFETEGIAENVVKDLLGNDRIINQTVDMGAYENVR